MTRIDFKDFLLSGAAALSGIAAYFIWDALTRMPFDGKDVFKVYLSLALVGVSLPVLFLAILGALRRLPGISKALALAVFFASYGALIFPAFLWMNLASGDAASSLSIVFGKFGQGIGRVLFFACSALLAATWASVALLGTTAVGWAFRRRKA